jgi:SAM-dependent methyltransferase
MKTTSFRAPDWAFAGATAALLGAIGSVVAGRFVWTWPFLAAAAVCAFLARRTSVRDPRPMPHAVRWVLLLPRGGNSVANLQRILAPRRGERLLEVGPGIGVFAIPVARALAPDGTLDLLDIQPAMLAEVERRAARAGIANVATTPGNAERLPYPDASFDAAYLVGVLGEIPDQAAALRELRRVLRPEGRLVVGEAILDPDYVRRGTLARLTREAGFVADEERGSWTSYFARFRLGSEPATRSVTSERTS